MTEISRTDANSLLWDVTTYIWAEADILDRQDYDAWLNLWSEDGLYIMPMEAGDDYANQLNLCYDNTKMRKDRIGRFQAGFSISSAPPAQTVRTISRVVIDSVDNDTIIVRAAEHLVENKFGRQRVWAGNVSYTLNVTEDGFVLRGKVVRLLDSDGMLNSFSYLF